MRNRTKKGRHKKVAASSLMLTASASKSASQKTEGSRKNKLSPLFTLSLVAMITSVVLLGLYKYPLPTLVEIELTTKSAQFVLKDEGKEGQATQSEIELMSNVALDAIDIHDFVSFKLQPSRVYISCSKSPRDGSSCSDGWKLLTSNPREVVITPVKEKRYNANVMVVNRVEGKNKDDSEVPLSLEAIKVRQQSKVTLDIKDQGEAIISLGINVSKQKSQNQLALSQQVLLYTEFSRVDEIPNSSKKIISLSNQTSGGQVKYKMRFSDETPATVEGNSESIQYYLTPHEKTGELFDAGTEPDCKKCIPARSILFPSQDKWKITYLRDIQDKEKHPLSTLDHLFFDKDFLIMKITWDRENKALKFFLQGDAAALHSTRSNIYFSLFDYLWKNSWWARVVVFIGALLPILISLLPYLRMETKGENLN